MTLLLVLAYVAVAALLLNLCVASPWNASVKAGAIALVSLFYGATWFGIGSLQGWPTRQPMPEDFRVHWIAIDEPDKRTGSDGAIYFWLRALDEAELPTGEPRAHVLPYEQETAETARLALEALQGGKRLNGRLTMGLIDPGEADPDEDLASADEPAPSGSADLENRPRFTFREVAPPDLPPKPPTFP